MSFYGTLGGSNMKKSMRLYHMIHFVNTKTVFNLADLMEKFNISRRTALRDIKEIEMLGVPIYSEVGKNGGYRIIRERNLTKIDLTNEEVNALIFALTSIANMESLPFSTTYEDIFHKLYTNSSAEQRNSIDFFKDKVKYHHIHVNKSGFDVTPYIQMMTKKKWLQIIYDGKKLTGSYGIIGFLFKNGLWFMIITDESMRHARILNAEKINQLEEISDIKEAPKITMDNFQQYMFQSDKKVKIEIQCQEHGLNLLKDHLWDSMTITPINDLIYNFQTYVDEKDLKFISSLLSKMGKHIKVIAPASLKQLIVNELEEALAMY